MSQARCQTQTLPPGSGRYSVKPEARGYEEIMLAFESWGRKGQAQISYRAGKWRVRLLDADHDAVCCHEDFIQAIEAALEAVGALA